MNDALQETLFLLEIYRKNNNKQLCLFNSVTILMFKICQFLKLSVMISLFYTVYNAEVLQCDYNSCHNAESCKKSCLVYNFLSHIAFNFPLCIRFFIFYVFFNHLWTFMYVFSTSRGFFQLVFFIFNLYKPC